MSNYREMILGGKTANPSVIAVKPCASSYERERCAENTSERLLQSAAVLPERGFLGWRIVPGKDGNCSSMVYSSQNVMVTDEDYNWIFQGCGDVLESGAEILENALEVNGKTYGLRYISSDDTEKKSSGCRRHHSYDYDDGNAVSSEHFSELMGMLEAVEAEVVIFAFKSSETGSASGRIIIRLQGEMSLRMRTMISLAIPDTEVYGIDDMECDTVGFLPSECIGNGVSGFLQVLMSKNTENMRDPDKYVEDEYEEIFEDLDEKTDEKQGDEQKPVEIVRFTPIEEMELSVRSYNCLKRAGIDSVEKLRSTPDEELMKVRNLGRKSFEEVKERLSMFPANAASVPLTAQSYSAMLDGLIGLECVKEQVKKITAFAKMKKDMPEDASVPMVLNMEFIGNPGTAKTTVARILAGILNEVGLLSDNGLIEVGRADLIARYEGQTADKVKSVFNRAKGKVLFIDEAYSLLENWEGEYGDEAINTIVQEMENNRNDTIVIFAGYPDKMEAFFARNPGLRSRVPFVISFKDYTADEMAQIADMEAEKRGFSIDCESRDKVVEICKSVLGDPNMGNGRFCRNLVEDAILSYASRNYGEEDGAEGGDFTLIGEDFRVPGNLKPPKPVMPMGFRV